MYFLDLVWSGVAESLKSLVSVWWEHPQLVDRLNAFRRVCLPTFCQPIGSILSFCRLFLSLSSKGSDMTMQIPIRLIYHCYERVQSHRRLKRETPGRLSLYFSSSGNPRLFFSFSNELISMLMTLRRRFSTFVSV